jgi:hypothetical protein
MDERARLGRQANRAARSAGDWPLWMQKAGGGEIVKSARTATRSRSKKSGVSASRSSKRTTVKREKKGDS